MTQGNTTTAHTASENLGTQILLLPFRVAETSTRLMWSSVKAFFGMGVDSARFVGDVANKAGSAGRRSAEKATERVRESIEDWGERLDEEVESTLQRLDVPSRQDYERLEERLSWLDSRLDESVARGRTRSSREPQRHVYHVSPHEDGWKVTAAGDSTVLSVHSTKDEALSAGRELAREREPSQMVVHKQDGTIQTSYTYGD